MYHTFVLCTSKYIEEDVILSNIINSEDISNFGRAFYILEY